MNRWLGLLFGVGLLALALLVAFDASLTLPTRTYPHLFHFLGVSRFLLSMAMLLFGAVSISIALGRLAMTSSISQWAVGVGMVLLGVAFISAPRY